MQVREIMTENPVCCTPDTNLQEVARLMLENDCGLIPVVDNQENKKPVGTITDRDIAVRTFAAGQNPLEIKASNIMTMGVTTVTPETGVQECCDVMENKKIRRVLVVDENGRCCGIVAQADVAEYGHPDLVSNMVEEISESAPTPNPRRSFRSRSTQSYSAPPPMPELSGTRGNQSYSANRSFIDTGNKTRFRSERNTVSTKKSSFSFKSILPLLLGIGTGAALKYFVNPTSETKRREGAKRNIVGSTPNKQVKFNETTRDFPTRTDAHTSEIKDVVTGTVTSSTQADKSLIPKAGGASAAGVASSMQGDKLNTGIDFTQKDKPNISTDSTQKDKSNTGTETGKAAN